LHKKYKREGYERGREERGGYNSRENYLGYRSDYIFIEDEFLFEEFNEVGERMGVYIEKHHLVKLIKK